MISISSNRKQGIDDGKQSRWCICQQFFSSCATLVIIMSKFQLSAFGWEAPILSKNPPSCGNMPCGLSDEAFDNWCLSCLMSFTSIGDVVGLLPFDAWSTYRPLLLPLVIPWPVMFPPTGRLQLANHMGILRSMIVIHHYLIKFTNGSFPIKRI